MSKKKLMWKLNILQSVERKAQKWAFVLVFTIVIWRFSRKSDNTRKKKALAFQLRPWVKNVCVYAHSCLFPQICVWSIFCHLCFNKVESYLHGVIGSWILLANQAHDFTNSASTFCHSHLFAAKLDLQVFRINFYYTSSPDNGTSQFGAEAK